MASSPTSRMLRALGGQNPGLRTKEGAAEGVIKLQNKELQCRGQLTGNSSTTQGSGTDVNGRGTCVKTTVRKTLKQCDAGLFVANLN
jgi:hypothetical protein